VLFKRRRTPSPVRRNASDDWRATLPREKNQVFENTVRGWECSYAMLSVSLDEALAQRARGELVCAQQQVAITSELLLRLTSMLTNACAVISESGKQVSNLPLVQPLHSEFFRGDTGQSAASWNSLLHNVLLGERSRFFHKLRILSNTVEHLGSEFEQNAHDIASGLSVKPAACWEQLDSLHYDLNTCLRESEVILKSFLHALPTEHLAVFGTALNRPRAVTKSRPLPRATRASA
jgi:hypothetical protein